MTVDNTSSARDTDAASGGTVRPSTFRSRQNATRALVLAAVVMGWLTAYQATHRLAIGAERVAHVDEMIAAIATVSLTLHAIETSHRDYALTGGAEPLDDYRRAIAAHREAAAELRRVIGHDAAQLSRLDTMEGLVAERIAVLDSRAAAAKLPDPAPAPATSTLPRARRFSGEVGTLISEMEQVELRALSVGVQAARDHARVHSIMVAANGVLTMLVLIGAFALINRDVNRQERDEQRLRADLRAADSANEEKMRFLATVSHEIRTPLNAVSGMTELLLDTRLDSEQAEYARTIHGSSEALANLIGDLLDSSKIDAGQVALESLPFDLRELVGGVAEVLISRAEIKGVELIVDVAPEVPWTFVGDRSRMRQVLMNLVGNAVKFTAEGEITIRVRSEPADEGRSAVLRMAVVDTGVGIAPEDQPRIFERFVQVEHSTVRRFAGTGLGLTISRSLIQLMGGDIAVDSTPGRGSTFEVRVTLPLAATQPPPRVGPGPLAGIDVVVTERNAVLRETLVRMLSDGGAAVREAGTAAEALSIDAAAGTPCVFIVGEPPTGVTGLDFARNVAQAHVDTYEQPGIVLICSLRSMMARYLGSHGIRACLYKPVKRARLIEAVRQAAGRETAESPRPSRSAQEPRDGLVPKRILLAEDNRDNRAVSTRFLTSAGYDVHTADDGAKAVAQAAAFRYDLILMDIEMPEVDGIEATRRIRAQERASGTEAVPIVAVTAHALEQVRQDAHAAGMNDYITKPLQKGQLLDICERWLDPRPRVLIADDAPENHVLLANYLGASDYRVVSVYNGRAAVQAFEQQNIALVLLDMNMPVMSGYDAARAIRRAWHGAAVPIVALTGYDGPDERQRCMSAGCTAYLSKPVHRADLLGTIDNLLGRPSVPRERLAGRAESQTGAPADGHAMTAALPSDRDVSNQVRSLLARQDFDALAELASSLEVLATRLGLQKLVTVCEEIIDAVRQRDAHRSTWWAEQLVGALREAHRLPGLRQRVDPIHGGSYDSLAQLAARLLGVPSVGVTVVDDGYLRIRGAAGVRAGFDRSQAIPLSDSLGWFVTSHRSPMLIEDARIDPRVRHTPLVVSYGLVAYAGVPFTGANETTAGVFCAMDDYPHRWSPEDVSTLEELAVIAGQMLDLERANANPGATEVTRTSPGAVADPQLSDGAVVVDDDIIDLVPDYVLSRRQDVEAMRALLEARNLDAIARLAHKMKGSGLGYGLPDVSRIGRVIEDASVAGDDEAVGRGIGELNGFLSRLCVRATDGRVVLEP